MHSVPEDAVPPAADPIRYSGGGSNRREFLRLLGLGFLASYTVVTAEDAEAAGSGKHPFRASAVGDAGTTFPQSVASGDPTASGVIFWTRLAPGMVTGTDIVALEIALDADLTQLQLRVRVPASQITAALDYTCGSISTAASSPTRSTTTASSTATSAAAPAARAPCPKPATTASRA